MEYIELVNKILTLYDYISANRDINARLEFEDACTELKEKYNKTLNDIL